VPITRDGRSVAAMSTDDVLGEDPELIRVATEATLVAVEQGHLAGELRASRARLVEAGDAERRRIGRDLHDSAQQRLVAMRVHLSLARDQLDDVEQQAVVDALGHEVDDALDELRTVALGAYPAVLAEHGVAAALRSAMRHSAIRVAIMDHGIGRHPEAVENALYFSCLEALQNAAKHAGDGSSVTVDLCSEGGPGFRVTDDGLGFDVMVVRRGAGLTNIADRLEAVGGAMQIVSQPGQGTTVSARIPLDGSEGTG
jgi:signal transduction histidine kinase